MGYPWIYIYKIYNFYLNGADNNIRQHNKRKPHHIEQWQSHECFTGGKFMPSEDVNCESWDSNLRRKRKKLIFAEI